MAGGGRKGEDEEEDNVELVWKSTGARTEASAILESKLESDPKTRGRRGRTSPKGGGGGRRRTRTQKKGTSSRLGWVGVEGGLGLIRAPSRPWSRLGRSGQACFWSKGAFEKKKQGKIRELHQES